MLLNTIKKLECQLIKTIYINYGFSPESIILIKSYPEFVYKVNYKNSKFILKILKKDKIDKLTKITKHAKRHFWLNDVCTCHGLLPSHSA